MLPGTIILSAIALMLIVAFFVTNAKKKREKKMDRDPRSYITPNKTNYNIASNISDDIDNISPAEAREILRKAEESNLTSLSNEDFFKLKEKAKIEK